MLWVDFLVDVGSVETTPLENTLKTLINHRCRHRKTGLLIKETTMQHWWYIDDFDLNINDHWCFSCANSWNIDVPLMFSWWLVDDFLKKHRCNIDETLMISMETLKVSKDYKAQCFNPEQRIMVGLPRCMEMLTMKTIWFLFDAGSKDC